MTVYIELLFLDNLLMNVLTLMLAARLASRRVLMLRTWISAALGAGYALVFFLSPPDSLWSGLLTKLAVAVVMVAVAARPRSWRALGAGCAYFLLATCILGGITMGVFYLTGTGAISTTGAVVSYGVPFRIVLAGVVAGCMLLEHFRRSIRERAHIDLHSVLVTISTEAGEATMRALVDTGNGLTEPISGAPVVLVSEKRMREVQPQAAPMRSIPCMTIGGLKMLRGFKASSVRVQAGQGAERVTEGVYVAAVNDGRLGADVDAIIGPLL